ncbi:hypothetical protein HYPSUDRAFT_49524 [Hypholoma sublateritium FD-334 SS-4]|uniref:Uncharacterized protein n=1 Tax=Hypholoma sublateritium (strain FD-334 SS-4) TaxID=945553 RepID=A0A0D2NBJ6_HYPSF|nr:hypothetical protein HYPSUDRAFT_49524 [Hypholoma sublateritium FD-334 SS-4]
MIVSFHNSISSAVRKTLQFIGIVSPPHDPVAFEKLSTDGTDIERYIQSLANGYNAHGAARMQDYRVEELYLCKKRAGIGNEYVSAKVIGPHPVIPFYIIFKRLRAYIDSDTPCTSAEPAEVAVVHEQVLPVAQVKEIVHASSNQAIPPSCFRSRHMDDKAFMSFTCKVDEIHGTVIFQHPIPLYTVAVLAVTVHRSQVDSEHESADASCHFYAVAIMSVVEQLYPTKTSYQNNSKSIWAKVGRAPEKRPISAIYSATRIKPEALQSILDSYKVDLENFENQARSKDKQVSDTLLADNEMGSLRLRGSDRTRDHPR